VPIFREALSPRRVIWLPPSAAAVSPEALPREADKDIDLLFVGKVDAELTPRRAALLGQLAALFPGLVVTRGNWRELFPRARIVLNVAEHGDLNFRVFEALSVGSCLLTPEVGHGLTELFTPGEHLFTYPPGDLDALAATIRTLLSEPARRERVARQGFETLRQRHGPAARADRFARWITAQPAAELTRRRLEAARAIPASLRLLYLHWAEALPGDPRAALYLAAAKGCRPAGSGGL
jgi:glycosyltransferase involved in cell wall biosynthesis